MKGIVIALVALTNMYASTAPAPQQEAPVHDQIQWNIIPNLFGVAPRSTSVFEHNVNGVAKAENMESDESMATWKVGGSVSCCFHSYLNVVLMTQRCTGLHTLTRPCGSERLEFLLRMHLRHRGASRDESALISPFCDKTSAQLAGR